MNVFAEWGNKITQSIRKHAMAMLCLLIVVQTILVVTVPAAFASAEETTVFAASSVVNVYPTASSSGTSLGKASSGREYTWLDETTDSSGRVWYKIQYTSAKTGWISSASSYKLTPEIKADPRQVMDIVAKAYGTVGIQVATVDNGVLSGTYNHGWAIKDSKPMATDSKIRAASLSKVAIAMTALRMQEQGLVDLDDKIGPYWRISTPKAVTLSHLLTHTSTIADISTGDNFGVVQSQLSQSRNYTTGTLGKTWYYNNFGAAVAGATIELAAGELMDTYADREIFNRLGIDAAWMSGRVNDTSKLATLYYADDSVGRTAGSAAFYVGTDTPGDNTKYYAGGFTCSAADYAKLIAILANDGTYDGIRYLDASSVEEMETVYVQDPQNNNGFSQCLALRVRDNIYNQSRLFYHTGNAYGMLALASYNPSTRDGVVVLTTGALQNTDSYGIYSICGLLSRYFYEYMDNVVKNPATAVEIVSEEAELKLGESVKLTAVLTPADSDSKLVWTSSNPDCVTVSAQGTITAVGHGSAVITAAAGDVYGQCTVNVTPPDIDISMIGASVRVSEPYGLRFGVQLAKDEELDSADIVEYGTIIAFEQYLGGEEPTFDTPKITRIPAENIFQETDTHILYTGVIINIPSSFFETNLVGRGYIIYRDVDGTEHTIYSNSCTRNFSYVVTAEYNSIITSDNPTQAQLNMLEKLKALLGIGEEQTVVSDSEIPANASSSVMSPSDVTPEDDSQPAEDLPAADTAGASSSDVCTVPAAESSASDVSQ